VVVVVGAVVGVVVVGVVGALDLKGVAAGVLAPAFTSDHVPPKAFTP
jgi:hypothetical protein